MVCVVEQAGIRPECIFFCGDDIQVRLGHHGEKNSLWIAKRHNYLFCAINTGIYG